MKSSLIISVDFVPNIVLRVLQKLKSNSRLQVIGIRMQAPPCLTIFLTYWHLLPSIWVGLKKGANTSSLLLWRARCYQVIPASTIASFAYPKRPSSVAIASAWSRQHHLHFLPDNAAVGAARPYCLDQLAACFRDRDWTSLGDTGADISAWGRRLLGEESSHYLKPPMRILSSVNSKSVFTKR